ncbi:MAG: T9SS type A sorting domain-containing protein [Saprospiraceae bacterium]|nr:T9SS type A sorting domain-containing protein [Candidatus Opimibacter skivensis]
MILLDPEIGLPQIRTTGLIQWSNVVADDVQVFDYTGRMVQRSTNSGTSIDLSGQPAGLYILQIREKDSVYTALCYYIMRLTSSSHWAHACRPGTPYLNLLNAPRIFILGVMVMRMPSSALSQADSILAFPKPNATRRLDSLLQKSAIRILKLPAAALKNGKGISRRRLRRPGLDVSAPSYHYSSLRHRDRPAGQRTIAAPIDR